MSATDLEKRISEIENSNFTASALLEKWILDYLDMLKDRKASIESLRREEDEEDDVSAVENAISRNTRSFEKTVEDLQKALERKEFQNSVLVAEINEIKNSVPAKVANSPGFRQAEIEARRAYESGEVAGSSSAPATRAQRNTRAESLLAVGIGSSASKFRAGYPFCLAAVRYYVVGSFDTTSLLGLTEYGGAMAIYDYVMTWLVASAAGYPGSMIGLFEHVGRETLRAVKGEMTTVGKKPSSMIAAVLVLVKMYKELFEHAKGYGSHSADVFAEYWEKVLLAVPEEAVFTTEDVSLALDRHILSSPSAPFSYGAGFSSSGETSNEALLDAGRKLAEARARIQALERNGKSSTESERGASAKNAALEAEMRSLRARVEEMEEEVKEKEREIEAKEDIIRNLNAEDGGSGDLAEAYRRSEEEGKAREAVLKQEALRLRDEVSHLKEENEVVRVSLAAAIDVRADVEARLVAIENQHAIEKAEIRREILVRDNDKAQLNREVSELSARLKKFDEAHDLDQDKIEKLSAELESARDEKEGLEEEYAKLEEEIKKLRTSISKGTASSAKELEKLSDEKSALEERLRALEARRQKEEAQLNERALGLERRLREAEVEKSAVSQELEELKRNSVFIQRGNSPEPSEKLYPALSGLGNQAKPVAVPPEKTPEPTQISKPVSASPPKPASPAAKSPSPRPKVRSKTTKVTASNGEMNNPGTSSVSSQEASQPLSQMTEQEEVGEAVAKPSAVVPEDRFEDAAPAPVLPPVASPAPALVQVKPEFSLGGKNPDVIRPNLSTYGPRESPLSKALGHVNPLPLYTVDEEGTEATDLFGKNDKDDWNNKALGNPLGPMGMLHRIVFSEPPPQGEIDKDVQKLLRAAALPRVVKQGESNLKDIQTRMPLFFGHNGFAYALRAFLSIQGRLLGSSNEKKRDRGKVLSKNGLDLLEEVKSFVDKPNGYYEAAQTGVNACDLPPFPLDNMETIKFVAWYRHRKPNDGRWADDLVLRLATMGLNFKDDGVRTNIYPVTRLITSLLFDFYRHDAHSDKPTELGDLSDDPFGVLKNIDDATQKKNEGVKNREEGVRRKAYATALMYYVHQHYAYPLLWAFSRLLEQPKIFDTVDKDVLNNNVAAWLKYVAKRMMNPYWDENVKGVPFVDHFWRESFTVPVYLPDDRVGSLPQREASPSPSPSPSNKGVLGTVVDYGKTWLGRTPSVPPPEEPQALPRRELRKFDSPVLSVFGCVLMLTLSGVVPRRSFCVERLCGTNPLSVFLEYAKASKRFEGNALLRYMETDVLMNWALAREKESSQNIHHSLAVDDSIDYMTPIVSFRNKPGDLFRASEDRMGEVFGSPGRGWSREGIDLVARTAIGFMEPWFEISGKIDNKLGDASRLGALNEFLGYVKNSLTNSSADGYERNLFGGLFSTAVKNGEVKVDNDLLIRSRGFLWSAMVRKDDPINRERKGMKNTPALLVGTYTSHGDERIDTSNLVDPKFDFLDIRNIQYTNRAYVSRCGDKRGSSASSNEHDEEVVENDLSKLLQGLRSENTPVILSSLRGLNAMSRDGSLYNAKTLKTPQELTQIRTYVRGMSDRVRYPVFNRLLDDTDRFEEKLVWEKVSVALLK